MRFILLLTLLIDMVYAIDSKTQNSKNIQHKLQIECIIHAKKDSCIKLIDNGLPNIYECNIKQECGIIGIIFHNANRKKEAIPYFKKIQELSDIENHNSVGLFYKQAKDYINAKKHFELGCAKKSMQSCLNLGIMYHNGQGIKRDYKQAIKLYKQACEAHIGEGCYNVGLLYHNGQGEQASMTEAKKYFQKSCDKHYQDGCEWVAKLQDF